MLLELRAYAAGACYGTYADSTSRAAPAHRTEGLFLQEYTERSGSLRPDLSLSAYFGPNSDNRIPAAIAEPMTPATFGPMACMSRKFLGLSF